MDKKVEPTVTADWSDLPFDVLEHLTSFLPLPDYHRFSAVCQNWWNAAKQKRHPPAKQLPWLLVRDDSDPHKHRVFSISENRHYNIDFPELQGQYVFSSSYGWLFILDRNKNLKLLNPLMGKSYDLPPFPYSHNVRTYLRELIGRTYFHGMTYERAQYCSVFKAILDHDPAQRSDFTVLILTGYMGRLIHFWRPGNTVWIPVDEVRYKFDDLTYFKGKFYAFGTTIDIPVDANGTHVTCVVDVGLDPKITPVAPEVPVYDIYESFRMLLVDFRGELLMLQIKICGFLTGAIAVHKLDLEEGKYYACHHLDGYSLFLGNSSPVVIDPSQFPGCKDNCIYFTSRVNNARYSREDNGIYDMLKGTVSPFYPTETFHPEIVGPIWWSPNPW